MQCTYSACLTSLLVEVSSAHRRAAPAHGDLHHTCSRLHPSCTACHIYTCTTCTACTACTACTTPAPPAPPSSCSRAFGAILHKTEMQLRYFPSNSSITDMSISLAGVALHVKTNTLLAPRALASQTASPATFYLSGAVGSVSVP